jgi:hypothetical protein
MGRLLLTKNQETFMTIKKLTSLFAGAALCCLMTAAQAQTVPQYGANVNYEQARKPLP